MAHNSIFGLCFMPVCLIKSNCSSLFFFDHASRCLKIRLYHMQPTKLNRSESITLCYNVFIVIFYNVSLHKSFKWNPLIFESLNKPSIVDIKYNTMCRSDVISLLLSISLCWCLNEYYS